MKTAESTVLARMIVVVALFISVWRFANHFSYLGGLEERASHLEKELESSTEKVELLEGKIKRAIEVLSE